MNKLIKDILNQKIKISDLETHTLIQLSNMETSMPDYLYDHIEWELNERGY